MYLSEFIIINYRSCRKVNIKLENNYPNVLIGINDSGKSSILQAVGLLLQPKPKFNFVSEDKKENDISNTPLNKLEIVKLLKELDLPPLFLSEFQTFKLDSPLLDDFGSSPLPHESVVIGKFILEGTDVEPSNLENLSDHLKWAIETSTDNDNALWLARIFDGETKSISTYLLTQDRKNNPQFLYRKKSPELNKAKREFGIKNEEIENTNQTGRFKNIEIVRAIYKKWNLAPVWAPYAIEKEVNFWPEYRYLDWNITLDDLIQFANDVVQQNISWQLEQTSQFAQKQADEAQSLINQKLADLAEVLREDLNSIKSIQANIYFQVKSVVTDIMIEKENSDGLIHLDSQGDGVKRQIWFALLKWKALNNINEKGKGISDTKFIWCFDEPETHLYPKAQRDFFDVIKTVSEANFQSIISTHSTVFIDKARLDSINKADLVDGYTVIGQCGDIDDIYQALQIKNSDFLFYDKFLVVEGDTEQVLIPFLYELHFDIPFSSSNIQLINLGGKSKRRENQRILQDILKGFRKETGSQVVYIFDNDARSDFTEKEIQEMNCFFVGQQDIEDSISSSVWLSLVKAQTADSFPLQLQEIEHLKDGIPNAKDNPDLQYNQKFYEQLKRLVYRKAQELGLEEFQHALPSKGLESGRLLTEHITSMEQVSPEIRKALEFLGRP